jgi:hypothetical protein
MGPKIDLVADLNAEDDEGLGWSALSDARDPSGIRPGVMLVAGNRHAQAVVRVVAIDDDGEAPGSAQRASALADAGLGALRQ